MALTGDPAGFGRSMGQLPGRMPLRVKLITAVLGLVAIALAVISVAGLGFLRSYLLRQADDELSTLAQSSAAQIMRSYLYNGQTTPAPVNGVAVDWLPNGGKVHSVWQDTLGYGMNASGGGPTGQLKPGPEIIPGSAWLSGKQVATVGATSGHGRFRVLAVPVTITEQSLLGPPGTGTSVTGTVIYAVDVTAPYQTIGELTGIDVIVSGILLIGLAIVGVAVIRASLRPLTDIERTAEAIAAGDLSRRVPERDPRTEIGRLGRSLNTMLAQIETAFDARSASEVAARRSEDRMRQFVADASHELRTPLTAIRGFAEYYRQRGGVAPAGPAGIEEPAGIEDPAGVEGPHGIEGPTGINGPGGIGGRAGRESGGLPAADLDRIMRRVEQEASRMGILVEDMLLLARLDQQRPLEHRTVDLLTLAADAVHDARVVAPDRSIHLTVGAGAALLVLGDEVRLRQVIGNLMSNALSHTPEGTPIDVRIRSGSLEEAFAPGTAQPARPGPAGPAGLAGLAEAGRPPAPVAAGGPKSAAVLEVTDFGPGLTREQAGHAFERFYRVDQARTTGGTGLGLAIVAALVTAHGGTVWVESAPGAGATFRIALPLAPEALHDAAQDDADDSAAQAPGHPGHPGDESDRTDGTGPGDQDNHHGGTDAAGPGEVSAPGSAGYNPARSA